jgi:osmotically-inducible protein OsmY
MTIDEAPIGGETDDRATRERLLRELRAQRWAEVAPANVTVKEGIVHLWSSYKSEAERRALIVAAESVPSVRRGAPGEPAPQMPARLKSAIEPLAGDIETDFESLSPIS